MGLTWGEIMNNSSFYPIFSNNLELASMFISSLINGAFERIWLKWQLPLNKLCFQLFMQIQLFVKESIIMFHSIHSS